MRSLGYEIVMYIDDSLLIGEIKEMCAKIVYDSCKLMDKLGFTIHQAKSVFHPTQTIEFLAFILDSKSLTVSLTSKKTKKIKAACT